MDQQTKGSPKISREMKFVFIVLLSIVGIMVAIAVPGHISYRPQTKCYMVEEDAWNIKAALSDYFADPAHTELKIEPGVLANGLVKMEKINNSWTLNVCGDNIFIHVVDSSGKCPAEYQDRHPQWHSGIYTLKFID